MKTFKYILSIFALSLLIIACKNETSPETKTVETVTTTEKKALNPNAEFATMSFEVEGMKCALGCAKVIEKNLLAMDGVKNAEVDFDTRTATVTYDTQLVNQESVENTVVTTSDTYKVSAWQNLDSPVIDKE